MLLAAIFVKETAQHLSAPTFSMTLLRSQDLPYPAAPTATPPSLPGRALPLQSAKPANRLGVATEKTREGLLRGGGARTGGELEG